MIEEHIKILIQAGVDGELESSDQAKLDRELERSEEARELHAELMRLNAFLERLPTQELPSGLHAKIVDGVNLPETSSLSRFFSLSDMPAFFRYGLGATAALVITLAVFRGGEDFAPVGDYSHMVGTMARDLSGQGTNLGSLELNAKGISGQVRLERRGEALTLAVDIESQDEVDLDINFAGNGVQIQSFVQGNEVLDSVKIEDEHFRGQVNGHRAFVLLMQRIDEQDNDPNARISLEFSRQGQVIHKEWFEPAW